MSTMGLPRRLLIERIAAKMSARVRNRIDLPWIAYLDMAEAALLAINEVDQQRAEGKVT